HQVVAVLQAQLLVDFHVHDGLLLCGCVGHLPQLRANSSSVSSMWPERVIRLTCNSCRSNSRPSSSSTVLFLMTSRLGTSIFTMAGCSLTMAAGLSATMALTMPRVSSLR